MNQIESKTHVWEPPFGFAAYDGRGEDADEEDMSWVVGGDWPAETCARAAAGRWLKESGWRDDQVNIELFPDDTGGGWGLDSPEDLREIAESHIQKECRHNCLDKGYYRT